MVHISLFRLQYITVSERGSLILIVGNIIVIGDGVVVEVVVIIAVVTISVVVITAPIVTIISMFTWGICRRIF